MFSFLGDLRLHFNWEITKRRVGRVIRFVAPCDPEARRVFYKHVPKIKGLKRTVFGCKTTSERVAHQFYEAIQHDDESPQPIGTICSIQSPLAGVTIIEAPDL